MEPGQFGIVLPGQASYPTPVSLPAGMKQVTLRQIQYNSPISGATPAATEFQVIIPQLDACFLDPSSTFLEVDASLTVNFGAFAVSTVFLIQPSNSNGGIIGSAASIFQRYQLYLNNAILSDDISEFGLVSYVTLLLSLNEVQRKSMHALLGLHPTHTGGVWGAPFHGQEMHHRATFTMAAGNATTGHANTNYPTTVAGVINNMCGVFWCVNDATVSGTTLKCVQDFQWNIQLPGLLGSGNDKLFPLFNGPTRISMFMDSFQNYFALDFATTAPNPLATYVPSSQFIQVNQITFVGDYVRCDPQSFNAIMSQLPVQNTFIMKTVSCTVASGVLAQGQAGTVDVLCPPRRASVKCVYFTFAPQGQYLLNTTGPVFWTQPYNLWGKYASINPNLTSGTCVTLNGVNYPQQTIDPMNRGPETFTNLLKCLQTWSNDAVKPNLNFRNWAVCDSQATITAPTATYFSNINGTVQAVTSNGAGSYWRPATTTLFRTNNVSDGANTGILTGNKLTRPQLGLGAPAVPTGSGAGHCFTIANGTTTNSVVTAATVVSMTDRTAQLYDGTDTPCTSAGYFFWEGTTSSENTTFGPPDVMSGVAHDPWADQFILGVDFEHLAKKEYLSGTSTLTGSFFLRMVILNPLQLGYLIYMQVWFDMLTILNIALRTAEVKI